MIKAIAFDPGVTTGFAVGEIADDPTWESSSNDTYGPMLVQTAQARMSHADIMLWLTTQKPNYIICESFEYRNKARTGLKLISREFIGVIRLYTEMNPDCLLKMHSPGQVINGYFSNARLGQLGLYRKPINGVSQIHANEACMHLLYWGKFGAGYQYCKGNFKLKQ